MYVIALTGGIASGKSAVSGRLAERGAVVIDADILAREVLEPGTPGLTEVAETFGPEVLTAGGALDRQALGAIIFADPDARARLNGITHPRIWARTRQLIAEAGANDPDAVVVYDVPLLAEAKGDRKIDFDLVVVVHADRETRRRRMIELRGMSEEEADRRLAAQAPDEDRLKLADVVIDSNGSLEATLVQADQLWASAKASAESKHRP